MFIHYSRSLSPVAMVAAARTAPWTVSAGCRTPTVCWNADNRPPLHSVPATGDSRRGPPGRFNPFGSVHTRVELRCASSRVFIATQLNSTRRRWTAYSRIFVYDVMTHNWVNWVTTFIDRWQLFTLWTCRQLDVELSRVELSCVAINTPLLSQRSRTVKGKARYRLATMLNSTRSTLLKVD